MAFWPYCCRVWDVLGFSGAGLSTLKVSVRFPGFGLKILLSAI